MNNSVGFRYSWRKSITERSPKILFALALVPLLGIGLTALSYRTFGYSIPFRIFLPVVFISGMLFLTIIWIKIIKYKGSLIPLAAFILLLSMGILVQTRLQLPGIETLVKNKNSALINRLSRINDGGVIFDGNSIRTYATACAVSLLCFIIALSIFSKKGYEWINRKYFLLFFSVTGFLLGIILLIKLSGGGYFLFSRVPWEILKAVLPLIFAGFLAENGRFLNPIQTGRIIISRVFWGPFFVITGVPFILFAIVGDYGQIMIYGVSVLVLLYFASRSLIFPSIAAAVFISLYMSGNLVVSMLPERIADRIDLWINFWKMFPSEEWWNKSYQTANAFFALKAGGLFGKGLGMGMPDLVPLVHSDFVYVEVAEEFGFIGTLSIYLLYLCLAASGIYEACRSETRFGFLAASALAVVLMSQVFINIGGVLNFIPLTGIVLPFISKGGFSLVTFSVMAGMLMAISHRNAVHIINKEILSESGYES